MYRIQLPRGAPRLVLQFEHKTGGVSQTVDGWRWEDQGNGLRIGRELPPRRGHNRLNLFFVAVPLFPWLQHDDDRSVVRGVRICEKIQSAGREHFSHAGDPLQIGFGALHELVGPLHRRAVGKREDAEEVALIFIRNEAGRQLHEQAAGPEPECGQTREPDRHPFDKEPDAAEISVRGLVEDLVETAEKGADGTADLLARPEHHAAQRRSKRESHDHREDHGDRNGERELFV